MPTRIWEAAVLMGPNVQSGRAFHGGREVSWGKTNKGHEQQEQRLERLWQTLAAGKTVVKALFALEC
jgi:hypothetical protein